MSLYVVDTKLSSSPSQKIGSGGMALLITAAILFILWFLKISVPNPPFELKQGVVEVDLGLVDGGFGAPDQGGPSPTPPALGGSQGEGGSPVQAGGEGKVVTSEGEKTVNLPPVDPPASTAPSEDPRLKDRLGKVGHRSGTGTAGNPNGVSGGSGSQGWGNGPNSGVQGNHGVRPGGTGLYSYAFTNYKLNSTVRKVSADGTGTIACRVSVDCGGRWSVIEYGSRGTTYTGSQRGLQDVVTYFLSHSTFEKIGDKCPESGLVYIDVKSSY